MSAPSTTIAPSSGLSAPVTMLMVVVLPDPFGPISPTISPRDSVKERPWTAWTPPKCLASPSTEKNGASASTALLLDRGGRLCAPRRAPRPAPLFDDGEEAVLGKALHQDQR